MKATPKWFLDSFFISREFLGFNLIFTAICIATIWSWQAYSIPLVFWIKVAGYTLQALAYLQFRSSRFMFFYNLGLGKKDILVRVVLIDLVISSTLLIPSYVLFAG